MYDTTQVHQDANASISVYLSTEQLGSERLAQAHALQLTPGQMSVHDAMLVHGLGVNRSSSRRAGVAWELHAAVGRHVLSESPLVLALDCRLVNLKP